MHAEAPPLSANFCLTLLKRCGCTTFELERKVLMFANIDVD